MRVMDIYSSLRGAGMEEEQAKVVAAACDLAQVATKADLESVRRDLTADISAVAQTLSQIQRQITGLYGLMGATFGILIILEGLPYLSP